MSPEVVLRQRADVASVELDGETVLWVDGVLHRLDTRATAIWERLSGGASLDEVAQELARDFRAPLEVVLNDVLALAERLLEQRAVEEVSCFG